MGKVARLWSALAISDDRLVALGYAELLYGRLHFGTAWQAIIGRNPLWQYLDLEAGCHKVNYRRASYRRGRVAGKPARPL